MRGIDVDRNGLVWTALGGNGHFAAFDRSKCAVMNGPTATGQHCAEGCTLYQTPGAYRRDTIGHGGPGSTPWPGPVTGGSFGACANRAATGRNR